MSLALRVAEVVYKAVLRVYPRSFRSRLGTDVVEAFRDGCRAARRAGEMAFFVFVMRATTELFTEGLHERIAARTSPEAAACDPSPLRSRERGTMIDRLLHDLRSAVRTLRRAPAFTAIVVCTLAVGIGASTAIFSVINGVLLRPLPYEDAEGLVVFTTRFKDRGGIQLSEPELVDLQTLPSSFRSVGAVDYQTLTLGGTSEPERIRVNQFSAEVLPTLGAEPVVGRGFTAEDDQPGADRVVLLSHALWQQGFGGDAQVVGQTLELEGIVHTVIGVMPPGFAYPTPETRAWTPLRLDRDDLWERNNHYLYAVGRLADGVSVEAARSELDVLSAQLNEQYPEFYADGTFGFEVSGMLDTIVGDSRVPLMTLLGAVAFVLLVACANVANLLLARSESRKREIAVRSALGSGRLAIVRQLLAESALLGLLAGAAGLALAFWGVRFLVGIAPDAIPRAANISIDGGVLGFTLAVSLLTSVLFGLLPAFHAAAGDAQAILKDSGRPLAGSRRGKRSRQLLVLAEVALAAVLLVGGGVMMRSFVNLRNVDPGFEADGVLTAQLALPAAEYEEPIDVVNYYEAVLAEVGKIAGAESVGAVARLPLARGANRWSLQIDGQIVADVANAPVGQVQQATPGYFEVMGVRLLSGRFFTEADRAGAAGVAIVSESFAALHWPGESAVGKRVKVFLEDWPWLEVVGVVGDVKQLGLDAEPFPKIYFAYAQAFETAYTSPSNMHLVIRTAGDPGLLAPPVRDAVWRVNDQVPFGLVAPMDEVFAGSIGTQRFVVALLATFAAVALFLALVGIAGVIAFSVSERTREIGIRVALGAERADILRLIVVPAVGLTLGGVALGIAGSTFLAGILESMLFEVSTIDAATYLMVTLVFVGCALVACYVPARRAARLDPVVTLRAD